MKPKSNNILWTALIMAFCLSLIAGCAKEYVHVGPNWNSINNLTPEENAFSVTVSGKKKARLGEDLSFTVKSEKTGKLWVVQVDPEDGKSIIFPNENMRDNHVQAGKTFLIPPKDAPWSFTALEPKGQSVLAFIVTTGDTDIDEILYEARKKNTKAIRVTRDSGWSVKKMIIDIQ